MRVTLIHNPGAGDPAHDEEAQLRRLIADAGHTIVARSRGDDAALDEPSDLVVVAGGDGTVGRVARRMVGRDVPMTILPSGTANNISRTLGLAELPPEELIAGWQNATVRRFDAGVIDGPWGSRRFFEGVGVGLFARAMAEIDAEGALDHLATAEERVAHARSILHERLHTWAPIPLRLTLDGRDLSGEYVMVEVMNIRFVGPNLFVAPGCDPTDGLFDVVRVSDSRRDDLAQYLTDHRGPRASAPNLETQRGRHLRIEGHGVVLHVDDETWPPAGERVDAADVAFDLRIEPGALRVLI